MVMYLFPVRHWKTPIQNLGYNHNNEINCLSPEHVKLLSGNLYCKSDFESFNLNWNWSRTKYIELLKIQGGFNRIKYFANSRNIV